MKSGKKLPKALKKYKRKLTVLKVKLFLFITLPIAIITIGHAVIKEYSKIKLRQIAFSAWDRLPANPSKTPKTPSPSH